MYLRQIAIERPQYAIAPPAVLNMLICDEALLASVDLSSLRCIGSGSAPLSPAMIAGFRERLGIEIVNLFGSNEGVSLVSGPDEIADPERRAKLFPRFGRAEIELAAPGVEIDRDPHRRSRHAARRSTSPGAPANCRSAARPSSTVTSRRREMTARAFTADGFFRTGDLFEIAADERGRATTATWAVASRSSCAAA